MSRRDEEYVDGAEFDDSDELVEEQSDDSDEFDALPSLPTAARQTLAERVSAKRKAADAAADAQAKATSTAPKPKRSALQKNAAYSWEAAYQRSWDHVQEDESGNLESAVRQMLEIHKRKRYVRCFLMQQEYA